MSKTDELAERLRTLTDSAIQTDQRIIETLQAENAKLRELVRDIVDYGEGAGNGMAEWFADRMRELGIEVDE